MKPGQKVVCVNNAGAEELTEKEIYTIKEVLEDYFGDPGLTLYEVAVGGEAPSGFRYGSFCTKRFRLVDYTFGEIIAEFIEEIILEES